MLIPKTKICRLLNMAVCLVCLLPLTGSAAQPSAPPAELIPSAMVAKLLERYDEQERRLIALDLASIRQLVFLDKKPATGRKPLYLATAGAPGARKSTILEHLLATQPQFADTVYADPDQRALRFMAATYLATSLSNHSISRAASYEEAQQQAYEHWRDASNYITNTLLNEAFAGAYDIAHGTTMTGPFAGALLAKIKDAGYDVVLALCGAQDELRAQAVTYRSTTQAFYQVTAADVVGKGLLFPQRMPVYFTYADQLLLHWSPGITASLDSAAAITRGHGLHIAQRGSYELFVAQYEKDRSKDTSLPAWADLLTLIK